jgi:hypothetical protein
MKIKDRYKRLVIWNKMAFWGSIASIIAIPLAIILHFNKVNYNGSPVVKKYIEPFEMEINNDYFEIFSKTKNFLWSEKVSGKIKKGIIDDIDNDNKKDIIIGVMDGGDDTGKIIAYNSSGEKKWIYAPERKQYYVGGTSGGLMVNNFQVDDLYLKKKKQIVVLYIDRQGWFQSCLSVLNFNGKLLATYWHPGHLYDLKIGSEKLNKNKYIIVAGANNDLRASVPGEGNLYCVFMLDPDIIEGEAPPYNGYSLKGTQLWYYAVTPKNTSFSRIDIIDSNNDNINEISLWTDKGVIFKLDFLGNLINYSFGDGAQQDVQLHVIN